jgi:hypothetical protein
VAAPALALLNEGVATAVGQGVATWRYDRPAFERTLRKTGGWYADDRIDPYAKTIYPFVSLGVAGGATLAGQAGAFTGAYRVTFGQSTPPATWLVSYLLILEGRRDAAFEPYFDAAPPRSIYGEAMDTGATAWRRWKGVAAVMGVTKAEWPRLRANASGWGLDAAELDRLAAGQPGLHVEARPDGAPLFLVAAEDRVALGQAMARFARLPEAAPGYTSLADKPR